MTNKKQTDESVYPHESDRLDLQKRAAARFNLDTRPMLPMPEVALLLDASGAILEVSASYSGERLCKLNFAKGLDIHEVLHPGCADQECEFLARWRQARSAHNAGLPIEWLFAAHGTETVLKFRLQNVSYACGVLFGQSVEAFGDCSVLFVQDTSEPLSRSRAANESKKKLATVYQLRRSTDPHPNLFASLDERLHSITSRLLLSQEAERKRIAAELHDGLGQTLSVLRYELENRVAAERQEGNDASKQALERACELSIHALRELREITANLRPAIISDLGLLGAIEVLCADLRAIGTEVELNLDVSDVDHSVPDELSVTVYRIAQEALNNIARHSDASLVSVTFRSNFDGVQLVIRDNGKGLPSDDALRRGLGMVTMRERTVVLGGNFSLESQPGLGCTVMASWSAKVIESLR
jgi:signal transduction histidine kinase